MGYVLNQFNQPRNEPTSTNSANNTIYMELLTDGVAKRRRNMGDNGVTGGTLNPFYDECIQFNGGLSAGLNYYFHSKIKRLSSDQVFYIYLVNYNDVGVGEDVKTQYLKTITVQGGSSTEWVDFELLFTPLIQFDCILFQLQRTIEDYRTGTRYPVIVYEELSLVKNMLSSQIRQGVSLIKMGIQSRPGLLMCINGEEIHIGRTGIYEVKNGIITVDFFSVVTGAIPTNNINFLLSQLARLQDVEGSNSTNSRCIFSEPKKRAISPFTLDYMYEEV
nr:MAG TPA: hypothetical protein [Caudoviricetes sp.]